MYEVVYYLRKREGQSVVEKEFHGGEMFRLRKNALHYVREIVQSDYREKGYATEPINAGIFCYRSEKDSNDERIISTMTIKVEKA